MNTLYTNSDNELLLSNLLNNHTEWCRCHNCKNEGFEEEYFFNFWDWKFYPMRWRIDTSKAIKANRKYAKKLGWFNIKDQLGKVLGLNDPSDEDYFAWAVAYWQQKNSLTVDGILGPRTYQSLKPHLPTSYGDTNSISSDNSSLGCNRFGERGGGRIKNKKDPKSADVCKIRRAYQTKKTKYLPIHCEAKKALEKMIQHARSEGIPFPQLYPTSAYRSYATQKRLWEKGLKKRNGDVNENRKWVARPGHSAHQSGRAVDLYLGTRNSSRNLRALKRTKAYHWLLNNAKDYGFYPYSREPWHWEFNPNGNERYVDASLCG